MALSNDLISEFVKVTKDDDKTKKETTVYGTAVVKDGVTYVKIDGSELLTPISSTADAKDGERVSVLIKNHTATINGNSTSPAARKGDVDDNRDSIAEMDNLLTTTVTATTISAMQATIDSLKTKVASISSLSSVVAEIETLYTKIGNIDKINAKDVTAINAEIENIQAQFISATGITTEQLNALNADIATLKGYTADFTYITVDKLKAESAEIKELVASKLTAADADLKYANIDFANITKASIETFFTKTGMIENVTIGDSTITGALVGVTIKGDLIEAGTLKADKLVILGEDGLYYKLNVNSLGETTAASDEKYQNGLDGSVIIAKSITAEKVSVNDLVAFGATIGGFHITDSAIYSGVKESATNTTRGIYLDSDGQLSVGDTSNFLRYYVDENGDYKLEISAESIKFGASGKTIDKAITDAIGDISIGGRNLLLNSAFTDTSDYWTDGGVGFGIYNGVDCASFSHAYSGLTKYVSQSVLGKLEPNKTYTLSGNIALMISEYAMNPVVKVYHEGSYDLDGVSTNFTYGAKEFGIQELNNAGWAHFTWRFATDDKLKTATASDICLSSSDMSGSNVWFYNLKLESGNMATDWSPAPEDISGAIDDATIIADDALETAGNAYNLATANEASIEVLNDKIVQVVIDENGESRLVQTGDGWSFDVGDYQKKVDDTSTAIDTINGSVNDLNSSVEGLKTYVRIESENDVPVIRLGAKDSTFEVVITNSEIDFKDGEEIPASISNQKLNIDTAEVKNQLQFGGFAWIPHGNNNMGVVWKGVDS